VAASYLQNVAEWVGNIATAKEEDWEYEMPALASPIEAVVVSLDGAMVPMADSPGYREAMVGTTNVPTLFSARVVTYGDNVEKWRFPRKST